jgi:hypothetical protein
VFIFIFEMICQVIQEKQQNVQEWAGVAGMSGYRIVFLEPGQKKTKEKHQATRDVAAQGTL